MKRAILNGALPWGFPQDLIGWKSIVRPIQRQNHWTSL
ncbi:hypothetical protein SynA1528_01188 [Synechococcus sp. A15-28]|nr:hypothetical protein SynA1528_01188 [Synechococcus sp. A15-28]